MGLLSLVMFYCFRRAMNCSKSPSAHLLDHLKKMYAPSMFLMPEAGDNAPTLQMLLLKTVDVPEGYLSRSLPGLGTMATKLASSPQLGKVSGWSRR